MYQIDVLNPQPVFGSEFLGSKFLNPAFWFNHGYAFFYDAFIFLTSDGFRELYNNVLLFLSLFFLTIISYSVVRLFEIRKKEEAHVHQEIAEYAHHQAEREKKKQEGDVVSKNEKWQETLNFLFSVNPGNWKLAVIEADSMLESLMTERGFRGENLGEKLRSANQETFRGLSSAWEAHTVRNRIAHEGSAFELSQREAKRIIALYEGIFREYGYI